MDTAPPCPHDPARLAAYLAGTLSRSGRAAAQEHLAGCAECRHAAVDFVRERRPARILPRSFRAAAAAVLVAAGAVALAARTDRGSDPLAAAGSIRAAQTITLRLADGSRLDLEQGAAIEDAAPRPGERRRVRLIEGAVRARVTAGAGFVIATAAGEVRVLGTDFDVRAARLPSGEPACRVAVREGRVRLSSPDGEVVLSAGQEGVCAPGAPPFPRTGPAARDRRDAERLLEELRLARRRGHAREARWLEAALATSGLAAPSEIEGAR